MEDQKIAISLPVLKACFEVTRILLPNVLLTKISKSKIPQLVLETCASSFGTSSTPDVKRRMNFCNH